MFLKTLGLFHYLKSFVQFIQSLFSFLAFTLLISYCYLLCVCLLIKVNPFQDEYNQTSTIVKSYLRFH